MKKTTSESFIKSSCFFYSKGNCSILCGAKENNKSVKAKCKPASICNTGVEIKAFVDSIKVPDSNFVNAAVIMSRYVT